MPHAPTPSLPIPADPVSSDAASPDGTHPHTGQPGRPHRKIIHVDMDAFYASVEQRDAPSLRGLPVAVGSSAARGVVAAASYEARAFGVRSAMASVYALRRCPDLVFVPLRFEVYRAVSAQIRAVFAEHTDAIEPLSLDEAYLDVTANKQGIGSATAIAEDIRRRIREETGLTASAGVSYNKFIAKLASDQRKPDGLTVIRPAQGPAFVASLPVERFHGVGPRTAARMHALGIRTGADLRDAPFHALQRAFGSQAAYLHRAAHGVDERPVRADRTVKSVGAERTFDRDLAGRDELLAALVPVVDAAWVRIARAAGRHGTTAPLAGRTVTLKAKYADFRIVTRAASRASPYATREDVHRAAVALLDGLLPAAMGIRLLGVTLSGLVGANGEDGEVDRNWKDGAGQLGLALK